MTPIGPKPLPKVLTESPTLDPIAKHSGAPPAEPLHDPNDARTQAPLPIPRGSGLPAPGGLTAPARAEAIEKSGLFAKLDPTVRTDSQSVMARLIKAEDGTGMLAFQRIISSPFFSRATVEQQRELLSVTLKVPLEDVDANSPEQGRGVSSPMLALAELSEREVMGKPVLLTKASDGGTLVHHIKDMTTKLTALPPNNILIARTGLSGAEIAAGAILEINDPGRVSQSNVGTCAATSLQIGLVLRQPAEYLRLVTGLAVEGSVMMASGDKLTRVPSSIPPSPGNTRTPSERLFQSAVLDYGNGSKVYLIEAQTTISRIPLVDAQPWWLVLIEALLCFPVLIVVACVKVEQSESQTTEQNSGMTQFEVSKSGMALYARAFPAGGGGKQAMEALSRRNPEGHFEGDTVQVGMKWSAQGTIHSNHALRLERIDHSSTRPRMVYLHNPWGSEPTASKSAKVGSGAPDCVIWEAPERGIVAIPYDEFVKRLLSWNGMEP